MRRLPVDVRRRVNRAIEALAEGDVRRLQADEGYRLCVGEWRVRLDMDANPRVITVVAVLPRGAAYKKR